MHGESHLHRLRRAGRDPSVLLVAAVALVLRWWAPGETVRTIDEWNWMRRAERFGDALGDGNLTAATVERASALATRPGITTMWIGFLAGEVISPPPAVARWFSVGNTVDQLRFAHIGMGLVCAAGVLLFTLLARVVIGRGAGLVAGGLLAVEPWIVGHSTLLHTDGLVTTFSATAVMGLVAALEAARVPPAARPATRSWTERPGILAGLGGLAGAIALLTKVNAAGFLGVAGVLALGSLVLLPQAARRELGGRTEGVRTVLTWGAVCLLVTVAAWPSLWVDPLAQLTASFNSAALATERTRSTFLFGQVTDVDRRLFAVVAWYRISPWLLVGSLAALVVWVVTSRRRDRERLPRRVSVMLTVPALAYAVAISLSDKQYDRYLLPLLPFLMLFVAHALVTAAKGVRFAPILRRIAWGGFALAALWVVLLAPFAVSFVDPLVGGQTAARDRIPLGWGEGIETVLADVPSGPDRCPTISSRRWLIGQPGCFDQVGWEWLDGDGPPPEYVLIYVLDRQRGSTVEEDAVRRRDDWVLVDRLTIDGVSYVELWAPTSR